VVGLPGHPRNVRGRRAGRGSAADGHQARGLAGGLPAERGLLRRDRRAGPLRASIVVDAKAGPGAPVTLRTDAGVSVDLPVTSCNEQFCEAAVAVDKTGILVTTINKATSGMAAYLIGNRIVMVPVSFRGSSAAIRAIGG
jgi:hypothetical protein